MARTPSLMIHLSESAQRRFLSLAPAIRAQLQRIIEGIAQLAASAPPVDPLCLLLPQFRPPLMRFSYSGVDVFYEVDLADRVLRLTAVHPCEALELAV